jgi:hypothetical protein
VPPQQAVQMVDDGVQSTLLVIGRAAPLNPGVRLVSDVVFQHLDQTGFAKAGLAAEQHHLPQAGFGLVPAPLQERHFFFAPYEWGQVGRGDGIEAALHTTLGYHAIDRHGRRHASERVRAQLLSRKVPLHEPEGRRADDHRIGRR